MPSSLEPLYIWQRESGVSFNRIALIADTHNPDSRSR